MQTIFFRRSNLCNISFGSIMWRKIRHIPGTRSRNGEFGCKRKGYDAAGAERASFSAQTLWNTARNFFSTAPLEARNKRQKRGCHRKRNYQRHAPTVAMPRGESGWVFLRNTIRRRSQFGDFPIGSRGSSSSSGNLKVRFFFWKKNRGGVSVFIPLLGYIIFPGCYLSSVW